MESCGIVPFCTDSVIWRSFHVCTERASLFSFPAAWCSVAGLDHAFCSLSLIHLNSACHSQSFTATNRLQSVTSPIHPLPSMGVSVGYIPKMGIAGSEGLHTCNFGCHCQIAYPRAGVSDAHFGILTMMVLWLGNLNVVGKGGQWFLDVPAHPGRGRLGLWVETVFLGFPGAVWRPFIIQVLVSWPM